MRHLKKEANQSVPSPGTTGVCRTQLNAHVVVHTSKVAMVGNELLMHLRSSQIAMKSRAQARTYLVEQVLANSTSSCPFI